MLSTPPVWVMPTQSLRAHRDRCSFRAQFRSWEHLSPEWGMFVTPERALAIQQLAASFKLGVPRPLKAFQRMLVLMASVSSVLQLGLLHMRPLWYWQKPWVPPDAWCHGCLRIKVSQACITALAPWKDRQWMERGVPLGVVCRRKVVSTNASNLGWGALCDGKPSFGPLVEEGRLLSYKRPGNTGSMVGPSHLSARPEGTSRLSPFGQYDGGVLHKSPGRSFLEAPLYPSRVPLEVGSAQLALAESSALAGQTRVWIYSALSGRWEFILSTPPPLGSRNSSLYALYRLIWDDYSRLGWPWWVWPFDLLQGFPVQYLVPLGPSWRLRQVQVLVVPLA